MEDNNDSCDLIEQVSAHPMNENNFVQMHRDISNNKLLSNNIIVERSVITEELEFESEQLSSSERDIRDATFGEIDPNNYKYERRDE
jgi:hypothetical protein